MLVYIMEEAVIGEVLKRSILIVKRKFARPRLTHNYASVRMRKQGIRSVCVCLCLSVCLCRLLQLLKDESSASKSFYKTRKSCLLEF